MTDLAQQMAALNERAAELQRRMDAATGAVTSAPDGSTRFAAFADNEISTLINAIEIADGEIQWLWHDSQRAVSLYAELTVEARYRGFPESP